MYAGIDWRFGELLGHLGALRVAVCSGLGPNGVQWFGRVHSGGVFWELDHQRKHAHISTKCCAMLCCADCRDHGGCSGQERVHGGVLH